MQHAQQQSPLYESQRAQKQIAAEELKAQEYWYLPGLSFSALYGVQGADPESVSYNDKISEINLALTEKLYDNGVSSKRKSIAEKKMELARLQFQRGQAELLRGVVSSFNTYSFFQKIMEVERTYRDEIQKQFKLTRNQYHQGLKSHRAFLKFKAQYNRSLISFSQAERRMARSKVDISNLLNLDPIQEIEFEVLKEFKGAQVNNPLVDDLDKAIRTLELEISEFEAKIIERQNWPEFYLAAGANYGSANYWGSSSGFSDKDLLSYSLTINLKFNIFDWGKTRHLNNAALLREDVNRANSQIKYETNRTDLKKTQIELEQLRATKSLSHELRRSEEESYRATEREFRGGSIGYYDFINSLDDYYSAIKAELQSDYDVAESELRLAALLGKLTDDEFKN